MKTIHDYNEQALDWGYKDFYRHSMLGIEMIVIGINLLYDGRC